jgi:hypothetical protein
MVSAISFPDYSNERSKILIKPDLKPIATVGSTDEVANLVGRSFWVENSVITSIVSEFQMYIF